MKGHLRITCARNSLGRNHLREQSFRAPLHLSKPHENEDALVVHLVNPTAGIFDDDEIEIAAQVESHANLVLTTPSSSRIYRSRNGQPARVRQNFSVQEGGFLEYYPEPFIPHAGARYDQRNTVEVDPGGRLAFFEWLTPGRVASGEAFQYEHLRWETDIKYGKELVVRERFALSPHDHSLASLRMISPVAHYLGLFVISDQPPPIATVHALESLSVNIGCGPLSDGGWVVKAVCADALSARRTLQTLRSLVYASLGRTPAWLARF